VRDKVGATHFPLPTLLHAFTTAGLTLDGFDEGGTPARRCSPSGPASRSRPNLTQVIVS